MVRAHGMVLLWFHQLSPAPDYRARTCSLRSIRPPSSSSFLTLPSQLPARTIPSLSFETFYFALPRPAPRSAPNQSTVTFSRLRNGRPHLHRVPNLRRESNTPSRWWQHAYACPTNSRPERLHYHTIYCRSQLPR